MLKTVLLSICKEENIQHPLLSMLETSETTKHSPVRQSPKKAKENLENSVPEFQSATKLESPYRRKRSDRASPTKSQRPKQRSPKELPLQIKDKHKIHQCSSKQGDTEIELIEQQNDHEIQDCSQIQMKYAQMMEELEEQPHELENFENTLQEMSNYCSRTTHLKNKKSSQLEHRHYYEQELSQLKNELEQYTKEEEKIMQILESSQIQSEQILEFQASPNEQKSKSESFTSMAAQITRSPDNIMITDEDLLNDFDSQEEITLIKPIKISSPTDMSSPLKRQSLAPSQIKSVQEFSSRHSSVKNSPLKSQKRQAYEGISPSYPNLVQQEEPYESQDCLSNPKIITSAYNKQKEVDIFSTGEFFGYYSKEKSDELKMQRNESIKRAEQLLNQVLNNQETSSKRPFFLNQYKSKLSKQESDEQDEQLVVCVNATGTQQQEDQLTFQEQYQEPSHCQNMFNEVSFQDQKLASINENPSSHSQAITNFQPYKQYPSIMTSSKSYTNLNYVGDSVSTPQNQEASRIPILQEQPSPIINQAQQKHSPFRKLPNTECYQMNQTIELSKNRDINNQYYMNNAYIDAEFLYEKRSKSVIKRRDEILKKKELENRIKIEAKYQRIEKLRQTRNDRLSLQQSRTLNKSRGKSKCDVSENISQISIEDPPYSSNIDSLRVDQIYRQSLPMFNTTNKNISNANSSCKPSLLQSECSTQRTEMSDAKMRCKTPTEISKKSSKVIPAYANKVGVKKQQQNLGDKVRQAVMIHNNIDKNSTMNAYLQTSQSFIFQETSAQKLQNLTTQIFNTTKSPYNNRPGITQSRSVNKIDYKGQQKKHRLNQVIQSNVINQICENCERLRSKGISTEFCLQH